jgi:hypothetical protein
VFAVKSWAIFASAQGRVHESWARFFGSSMKDDLRYTTSDCFDTFPFPRGALETARGDAAAREAFARLPADVRVHLDRLEQAGRDYYEFRADLMVRHNEGLTKTYNRFHDRDHDATEPDPAKVAAIQRLRELHAAMDRAVLDAYGWTDVPTACEFILDYEEDQEPDARGQESGKKKRGKKKPWRYRWPDDVRDDVLARLLQLNKQRAEEERLKGAGVDGKGKKRAAKKSPPKRKPKAPSDEGPKLL